MRANQGGGVGITVGAIAGIFLPGSNLVTVPLGAWIGRKIGAFLGGSTQDYEAYENILWRTSEGLRNCQKHTGR